MTTTMNGSMVHDAAVDYCQRGLPVYPCEVKKPLGGDGWQHKTWSEADIDEAFNRQPDLNFGILMGPTSGLVDIEADNEAEERLFADLFDGCDIPATPTYRSTRGKHRLFAWHPRFAELGQCNGGEGKGVVNYRNEAVSKKEKLGIRVGVGKAAQSVFPPSAGRKWLVDLDECEPAELPDAVVQRIIDAATPNTQQTATADSTTGVHATTLNVVSRARQYVLKMPPAVSGQGGHDQTFSVACRLVLGFGLSPAEAYAILAEYNLRCEPPWSEKELRHKIESAAKQPGERNYLRDAPRERMHSIKVPKYEEPERGTAKPPKRLTDYGNAERFVEQHGANVRHCHPWKKWLAWDGCRWKIDNTGAVERLAKATVRSIYQEAANVIDDKERAQVASWAKQSEKSERIGAMLKLARSEVNIPLAPAALDADHWLLNCPNGTIDLRTGELRDHDRNDLLTKLCPTRFNPAAPSLLWDTFLEDIFEDQSVIDFIQRHCGYSLTGDTREQVLLIHYGTGANGKTTFLNAFMETVGDDYAMKAPTDLLMHRKFEQHPTGRADLFGKRFVAAVETGSGQWLNETLVKELTGGDKVRARRMREDFWQFHPSHKLVVCTNHKPRIEGTDHAIWRRLRLVPFTVTFPDDQQDKTLPDKLSDEAEGILSWCVRGCIDWEARGLDAPAAVTEATQAYRTEQDTVGQFIQEQCGTDGSAEVTFKTLYAALEAWCQNSGDELPSKKFVGTYLQEHGFQPTKAKVRSYRGLRLQDDTDAN